MEDKTSIISNDTSLLERLNLYQKKVAEYSINPLQVHNYADESKSYHYQVVVSIMKEWVGDLSPSIKDNNLEKEEIKKWIKLIEEVTSLTVINNQKDYSFSGQTTTQHINEKNLNLIKKAHFDFVCYLKKITDKYFSDKPKKSRLIK